MQMTQESSDPDLNLQQEALSSLHVYSCAARLFVLLLTV